MGIAEREIPEALEPAAKRSRTLHRLVCVYATNVPRVAVGHPVFGLFGEPLRSHYERVAEFMPLQVHSAVYRPEDVELPKGAGDVDLRAVFARVYAPMRGRLIVTLALDFAGGTAVESIPLLDAVCHDRLNLKLRGERVVRATCADFPRAEGEAHAFEADVHEILLPAREDDSLVNLNRSKEEIESDLQSLVAREHQLVAGTEITYRRPPDLNLCEGDVAAIKSGVTVLRVVDKPDLETAATISAVQLLASLSELRRIRKKAAAALTMFEAERPSDRGGKRKYLEERTALQALSKDLEDLQLSLGFGVEVYMNMRLLVPQHRVHHFHSALAGALDMSEGVAATDRLLTRLHDVVNATREWVAAEERGRDEVRNRLWAAAAFAAIPLTLLFAFLGINTEEVKPSYSIFDLGHFWLSYLVLLAVLAGAIGLTILIEKRR